MYSTSSPTQNTTQFRAKLYTQTPLTYANFISSWRTPTKPDNSDSCAEISPAPQNITNNSERLVNTNDFGDYV